MSPSILVIDKLETRPLNEGNRILIDLFSYFVLWKGTKTEVDGQESKCRVTKAHAKACENPFMVRLADPKLNSRMFLKSLVRKNQSFSICHTY